MKLSFCRDTYRPLLLPVDSTRFPAKVHLVDVGFSVWVLVVLHVAAMQVSRDIKSAATVPFVIPICHCRNPVVADGRLQAVHWEL